MRLAAGFDYPELVGSLGKASGVSGEDDGLPVGMDSRSPGTDFGKISELNNRLIEARGQFVESSLAAARPIGESYSHNRALVRIRAWMYERVLASKRLWQERIDPAIVEPDCHDPI